jgi:hypothetical protein
MSSTRGCTVPIDRREGAVLIEPGRSGQGPSGSDEPQDCPECLVTAAVLEGLCEVCFAELDEVAPAGLPAAR